VNRYGLVQIGATDFSTCSECGVYVTNRETHDAWHDRLDTTIAAASSRIATLERRTVGLNNIGRFA
jgi:hypothetical protein